MSDKITYFKIGEQKILINLEWQSVSVTANSITLKSPRTIIADKAKSENRHFGFIFEKYNNGVKYTLLDNVNLNLNDKNKKNFSIGAALISSIYKNSIFIKKLDKEADDESIENKYWICHIDNEGDIFPEGDIIVYSDTQLLNTIKERADIFGSKIVAIADDVELLNMPEYSEIDIDLLKMQSQKATFQVIKVFKNDALKNKIIIGVFSTVLLSVCYVQFVYENEYKNKILNRDFEITYSENFAKFEDLKNKLTEVNKNDKSYYIEQGQIEFLDYYNRSFYTNTEILNNIYYLDSYMEEYAQEWKVSKYVFKDNDFFVTYEKINDSIGVFKDLDKYVKDVSDTNKTIDLKPFALVNSGNTRIYSVTFGHNLKKEEYLKNRNKKTLKDIKLELLKNNEENLSMINNNISDYEYQLSNLSKWNLFFTDNAAELYNEIEIQSVQLNDLYSEINKTLSQEEDKLVVDDSLLSNNILDYVAITQMDNLFKWSYPINGNIFPKIDSNLNKDGVHFARSYMAEISSVEKLSTDVLSMTEALTYLDKPYIQIQEVDFQKGGSDKNEEKWAIRLEIHTKNQD